MHTDVLHFDGSCDPNPGGRLGWGWHITWTHGERQVGQGEQAACRENTVNVAEYLALIAGLTAYREAGGQGPLLVNGDSQLVIRQVTREWRNKATNLQPLAQQVWTIVAQVAGDVTFQWRPRSENTEADAVAGGQTVPDGPAPRTIIADVATARIPPDLRVAIANLNGTSADPSFKAMLHLRSGGRDAYSAWTLARLHDTVGPNAVAAVEHAFPDSLSDQAAALRWAMRGLALELAIRKIKVDADVRMNRSR